MKRSHQNRVDDYFYVLSKLDALGQLNLLEIGFSATPQVICQMAKRGFVRVHVEITQRGSDHLQADRQRRARRKMKAEKAAKAVGGA